MSVNIKQENSHSIGGHSTWMYSHSHHGGSQQYLNLKRFHNAHHGITHHSYNGGFQKAHTGFSKYSYHGSLHKAHCSPQQLYHRRFQEGHHGDVQRSHHGGFHQAHHSIAHNSPHGESHQVHHDASHHRLSGYKIASFAKLMPSSHASNDHRRGAHKKHSGGEDQTIDGFLKINEKETLQLLNERLSSYLEDVHILEQKNIYLENKICEWYEKNVPKTLPDYSQYFKKIEEIQGLISEVTVEKCRIILQIDSARLETDGLKKKYENEVDQRCNTEADMKGLGRVLEILNQEAGEQERQVQNLQQEILQMRRDNEVEINKLTADLGARVSVEVEAAPSTDLSHILLNIREEYENLMERNLKEAENMFLERSQELTQEVSSGSEQMQSAQTEIIDLRHSMQTLEIELQSEQNMTSALEDILEETNSSYASHLSKLQQSINNDEGILVQIRSDLENQNQEYHLLMDQKTHLEQEISTYQQLLDGNDIQVIESPLDKEKHEKPNEEENQETQPQESIV